MAYFFKNASILSLTPGPTVMTGNIRVEGAHIVKLGPLVQMEPGDQMYDLSHRLVMPGFVQTHTHVCQTAFRNQADDLELMQWLRKKIWPKEAALTADALFKSAQLGIMELFSSGTTTICDMASVNHTEAIFEAAKESGIRAFIGKALMDSGRGVPKKLLDTTEHAIKESKSLIKKWHMTSAGRLRYALAPRFVLSCTKTLLEQTRDLALEHKLIVHTHACENPAELNEVKRACKMGAIAYFDKLGLTDCRLNLAHCVHPTPGEIAILKSKKINVLHCPSANLKLGSGIAPIPEFLKKGIRVTLGADGAACNNNLDMFQEMRLAALIQKPLAGATAMKARQMVKMATIEGAKALGLEKEIGTLEVGKRADMIVLNLTRAHCQPAGDIFSQLVYSTRAGDVEMTMVDGRVVYMSSREPSVV